MLDYAELFTAASQLPVDQRMQLIDDLTDTLPQHLSGLSPEWIEEINRRSAEIDAGTAELIDWEVVRADLFRRVGLDEKA
jgi:putative addiction module component (TIGR02574 family)